MSAGHTSEASLAGSRTEGRETCGRWRTPSFRLSVLMMVLVGVGLVMVASASAAGASGLDRMVAAALRRSLWICLGTVAFVVGCRLRYQFWRRHSLGVLSVTLVALLAVLVPGVGTEVNGARRWIRMGTFVGIQPSEFAKFALCIWLAAYCERNARQIGSFARGFLLPVSVVGLAAFLVLAEPDFGTAVILMFIGGAVLLVGGCRPVYFAACGLAMLPLVQKLVLDSAYRRERLMAFLNPWKDPLGAGYQLIQSKVAIGSGHWLGVGLGLGYQKDSFLPGANNDFIFSVTGEELGFAGTSLLVLIFALLVWEGLKVARRAPDNFGLALAFGISILIGIQAALNIAVATGSVPTTGLSLPFVSAGGSSLFFTMLAIGILVNIARSEEGHDVKPPIPWYRDVPGYERFLGRTVDKFGAYLNYKIARLFRL